MGEKGFKKRKEYYKTEEGKEIKKKYREKAKQKNKLIEELRRMKNCGTQAELAKGTHHHLSSQEKRWFFPKNKENFPPSHPLTIVLMHLLCILYMCVGF